MSRLSSNTKVLLSIVGAIVVPAVLTLLTFSDAWVGMHPGRGASPYGYTVSLMIYLVPIGALLAWFRGFGTRDYRQWAFRWTIGLLVPLGFLLDLVMGNAFLTFENHDAVVGFFLPGYSFETGGWERTLPIEEFIFYATGFVAILLVYVWCDEFWLSRYGRQDYGDIKEQPPYVLRLHRRAALYGVLPIAGAVLFKKLGPHDFHEGWPWYFVFLMVAAVLPALVGFRAAQPFINWRAFSLTFTWVLLTSLLWEVTLAVPNGWWGYNPKYMTGLFVTAWHDLPFEATIVWLVVTFTTVIVFELLKLIRSLDKPLRVALFGEGTFLQWLVEFLRS